MLSFYKVIPEAHTPALATLGSACFDISASLVPDTDVVVYEFSGEKTLRRVNKFGSIEINQFDRMLVPTNIILDIPVGHSVRIHPRSGLSLKQGLILANCEGVIDSDYVDPLFVMLYNISGRFQTVSDGDRIAQGELVQTVGYMLSETTVKPQQKTDRIGGFGSTGV
jgi:dUTP pyrophosphatase